MTTLQDYNLYLSRAMEIITARQGHQVKLPHIKTAFVNGKTTWMTFAQTCEILSRDTQHVLKYFCVELVSKITLDGTMQMMLRGRVSEKQLFSVLKGYIRKFVQCSCRSLNTEMTAGEISCNDCNARRPQEKIQTGFIAVRKTERRTTKKNF